MSTLIPTAGSSNAVTPVLPGLDCGLCGYPLCGEFAAALATRPELVKRCIHLDTGPSPTASLRSSGTPTLTVLNPEPTCSLRPAASIDAKPTRSQWHDSLGREFDFVLRHFPEDNGPREIIIPHNPMLTRELNVQVGDVLIGRPLGMSCGCPVTHCGVATAVDTKTGVITWCITGPLRPRQQGYKDLGFYIAEAYEGLVKESRVDLAIGMRYYFQPDMCMLQWRHSGLVNYLNRSAEGLQVRVEGLWIG